MKLNYKRTILVGFAFFLITAFWQAYDAIIPLILTNHFGLDQIVSGAIMSLDNILAVFMLPLFGAISDKIMTRFGKRTPFIFIGTVSAVFAFILLAFIDVSQIKLLEEAGIPALYEAAKATRDESALTAVKQEIGAMALQITLENIWIIIGFISVLFLVLIAMATFRSPAVALMPDVTVKPLRSKGNAIINLMGTAGGISVLVLGMIFKTSANLFMSYTMYVVAVCIVMLIGLAIFVATVKENAWARDMSDTSAALCLEDNQNTQRAASEQKKLSAPEFKSLLLILASVALWYIGYNSITSKYSVYATNELGFDFNATLIIAQVAAVIAYIPVGIIASKIGRKKTVLAGIVMLAGAFLFGNFITSKSPEFIMFPVFILAGIGWATINVNSFPMVVELARGGEVGKYTGYYYTASMSAQIVAPILSGALYDLFDIFTGGNGMRVVFFAFGFIFVALSFVTMLFVKHGDVKPQMQGALESLGARDD